MRIATVSWLLVLLLGLAGPRAAWAEEPPDEEPAAGEGEGEEPAAEEEPEGLVWLDDYEEAKAKAKEAGKGLFVYLTPSWFT